MPLPFAELRILDATTGIAGPYAGKLLVDAGAQVLKLEPPGGDPLRRWVASGRALAEGGDGALFQFLNAGKRSVCADLDAADGRARFEALARGADVVLEDAGPGVLAARGLDPQAFLTEGAPRAWVALSPWGQHGPWAGRPATEFTLQAACGATAYRGLPDRPPVAAGGQIGAWAAGSYAAVAALAGFLAARRNGRGQYADVSAFETSIAALTVYHDLQGQWFPGPLARNLETPSIEPTRDGWVGLCTYTGQQWKDFCSMIGRERPEVGRGQALLRRCARA